MSHEKDLEKWIPTALALPPETASIVLRVPRTIFLREATLFAEHVNLYWEPEDTALPRFKEDDPSLQQFTKDISTELDELRRASFQAEYNRQAAIDPKRPQGLVDKAIAMIDEISTACGYVLDDGIEEPADDQFSNIQEAHSDDDTNIANLSVQLFDFATFAKSIIDKLAKLGRDFNIAILDEALALSEQLAKLPAGPVESSPESKKWLERRNRILTLILQRVELIQKVAKFKYRDHPEIKQKFASTHERRRSLASLKKKLAASGQQQAEDQKQQAEIEAKKAQIREKLLEEKLTAEVKAELAQEEKQKK